MPKMPHVAVEIDVGPEASPQALRPEPDTPFRVLLLGDFSGRGQRGEPARRPSKPILIDRDNFDEVLARIQPELTLGPMTLRFRELDDFHPDRIYQNHPALESLRERRRRPPEPARAPQRVPEQAPAPPVSLSSGSLLDSIMEASEPRQTAKTPPTGDLDAFIRRAVASSVVPAPDPGLPAHLAKVDAAAGALLRAILHEPAFQELESAWRSVFWLVREIETGPELKLFLLDVSRHDLANDVNNADDFRSSFLYQLLAPHADTWTVAVGNFAFTPTEDDVRLLRNMARIMRAAHTPLLAEAAPGDATPNWLEFRRSPEAAWIGLLFPRFLLRLPYGAATDPIESFPFEEMGSPPVHQHYLWGNPAFAAVSLLAKAFLDDGWDFRPGQYSEVSRLPLHVYEAEGEQQLKPCAEIVMTEGDAEWALQQGFMPLVSVKDRDSIRLLRFQSVAEPLRPLPGKWS